MATGNTAVSSETGQGNSGMSSNMHSGNRSVGNESGWRPGGEHRVGDAGACSATGSRTDTGCSNWKPIAPSRRNTCCFATTSANPSIAVLEGKIANYLRRVQGAHGGWALVHDGAFDMSASVKAYFALKMIGDSADAPHMARAREAIRSRGGAVHSNVFTRFMLAMFGVLTWRSVPVLPIEIMLLPMWSPFHLNKISYWARTTIVPLMVLAALKPRAKNVSGVGIDELFLQPPHSIGMTAKAPHQSPGWFYLFRGLDSILRTIEPLFPKKLRARAIDAAVAFIEERLNGEDGLGAIYPPMANTVMMYEVLGKAADYPPRAITRQGDRQAAGDRRARGLLPALRLAGVGHRAELSCPDRSRQRSGAAAGQAGAGLAEAEAGAGRQGRLGREAAGGSPRRLGVPVQQ